MNKQFVTNLPYFAVAVLLIFVEYAVAFVLAFMSYQSIVDWATKYNPNNIFDQGF